MCGQSNIRMIKGAFVLSERKKVIDPDFEHSVVENIMVHPEHGQACLMCSDQSQGEYFVVSFDYECGCIDFKLSKLYPNRQLANKLTPGNKSFVN